MILTKNYMIITRIRWISPRLISPTNRRFLTKIRLVLPKIRRFNTFNTKLIICRRKRLGKSAITDEEEERWEFNGEYWDARKEGRWADKIADADRLW